jgi:CRISPR-associated protein Csx10
MKTIHYRVILKEPAIFTSIDGEPNSAVSYDFIPGAVMRGFFIGEKMRRDNIRELDPKDESIHRLFFSNQTRYLNLYPVINDRRSLPVPVSWHKKKYGQETTIYDYAIGNGESNTTDKISSLSGFADCYPTSPDEHVGQVTIYKPERILNVHTQRARRLPDEQQVYRYDALAPGQSFQGMILCQSDEDADTLYDLIQNNQQIHIGGARNAGYGLAHIAVQPDWNMDTWWEVSHHLDSTIVLTFLSDVILRDDYGHYSPTFDALKQAFNRCGITFEHRTDDYIAIQRTLVGGFNRKWGLPLPQTPAIKMGSVITLANVQSNEDDLWSLVGNGLGERTNEGFGQIALNWQRNQTLEIKSFSKPQEYRETHPETADGIAMWSRFETRINEIILHPEIIERLFTETSYKITGDISPSQLSRLRAKIADELRKPAPSPGFITDFLDDISGKKDAGRTGRNPRSKAAGKQFDRARIDGKSLLEWLRNPQFNVANDFSHDPQDRLRLIDVVLERAHKERTSGTKARR